MDKKGPSEKKRRIREGGCLVLRKKEGRMPSKNGGRLASREKGKGKEMSSPDGKDESTSFVLKWRERENRDCKRGKRRSIEKGSERSSISTAVIQRK